MRPKPVSKPKTPDDWVNAGKESSPPEPAESQEKIKRLTLDLPLSLHAAIKNAANNKGVTMVNMIRELLEREYRKK